MWAGRSKVIAATRGSSCPTTLTRQRLAEPPGSRDFIWPVMEWVSGAPASSGTLASGPSASSNFSNPASANVSLDTGPLTTPASP